MTGHKIWLLFTKLGLSSLSPNKSFTYKAEITEGNFKINPLGLIIALENHFYHHFYKTSSLYDVSEVRIWVTLPYFFMVTELFNFNLPSLSMFILLTTPWGAYMSSDTSSPMLMVLESSLNKPSLPLAGLAWFERKFKNQIRLKAGFGWDEQKTW